MTTPRSNTKHDTFKELKQTIEAKQSDKAIASIRLRPKLLLEKDKHNNTLLHLALAKQSNEQIIFEIFAALIAMKKLNEVAFISNDKGETILHSAITCTFNIMQFIVNSLGPAINQLARMCDNQGKLPIQIGLDKLEHKANIPLILTGTLHNPFIKFNQQIDVSELIKNYGKPKPHTLIDKKINEGLIVACDIINRTRKVIKKSYTHPEVNTLAWKERSSLIDFINKLRANYLHSNNQIKKFNDIFSQVKKTQAGNCDEMAWYALYQLYQLHPKTHGEIYRFGSHIIVVLNRELNSDPTIPSTWGETAIICDPWSGKAFPAALQDTQLESWTEVTIEKQKYNVVVKNNPNYHRFILKTDTIMQIKEACAYPSSPESKPQQPKSKLPS